ncbi:phosphoribosylformylglycinamidine synthase subunit I [Rubrobacter xylanophilus DSM 9941]|uniref:Phosphoribosylformylglycinamidine synthase subunit PurQ n=1 Tax=Rubrobacter xylanophilus (strain DSM 9941 / JCM 11954 / NBRC 16129 / PRD-1) TaxID=266117 RepID=PURQ_RUBXD|nr:phosphoribosylformylglycinamidine synthase subunit PurQ [Rubrobacter xylanophilus]Q1AXB7.1 RecName: Full=Phosphoribosylformylglycinamidine synthase subunit PurQ; Short=FGAM synthase; AltName: Full=Formylglycinamide ribonucleotide amidotransferase subunit I; Short=FGAR amidotransferase I; Short=FGAR-AT I; AltName: Full=Glutaminase PurQ; AltName: Full=Phosphoribosylformylglycinamidine synthase subunit I [Rubrobacter xylanophilus DSM 9941]ABG03961.1 phosphoribosylformylglycinamidine synthase subu
MRVGVVVFPGSNCDRDALHAVERAGAEPVELWHADADLKGSDAVILPGGFSYGDYLRPGAIARFARVMGPLEAFAREGGPVLGVCNGFQVLCEAHLLPGALLQNRGLRFVCRRVRVRVERADTPWTAACAPGEELTLPVAHNEGNYFADPATLARLEEEGRVVLRYLENPNGSANDIAGVCSEGRNVVGLMPHPERASDPLLGSGEGLGILRSVLAGAKV